MDYSTQATKTRTPLNYTFDAHFSPHTPDDDLSPRSSDSKSRPPTFQLIANTMLRMELAQLEMMKKRETARLEAQKRQAELEHEMTRMMLQTQVHIASMVYHTSTRKRNSSGVIDHHSTTSTSRADLHRLSLPAFFNGSIDAVDQVSLLLFNAAVMELYF